MDFEIFIFIKKKTTMVCNYQSGWLAGWFTQGKVGWPTLY
jgi:hypothetical protein